MIDLNLILPYTLLTIVIPTIDLILLCFLSQKSNLFTDVYFFTNLINFLIVFFISKNTELPSHTKIFAIFSILIYSFLIYSTKKNKNDTINNLPNTSLSSLHLSTDETTPIISSNSEIDYQTFKRTLQPKRSIETSLINHIASSLMNSPQSVKSNAQVSKKSLDLLLFKIDDVMSPATNVPVRSNNRKCFEANPIDVIDDDIETIDIAKPSKEQERQCSKKSFNTSPILSTLMALSTPADALPININKENDSKVNIPLTESYFILIPFVLYFSITLLNTRFTIHDINEDSDNNYNFLHLTKLSLILVSWILFSYSVYLYSTVQTEIKILLYIQTIATFISFSLCVLKLFRNKLSTEKFIPLQITT